MQVTEARPDAGTLDGRRAAGSACLETLNHAYLVCNGSDTSGPQEDCIVEPLLSEHFRVADATPDLQEASVLC